MRNTIVALSAILLLALTATAEGQVKISGSVIVERGVTTNDVAGNNRWFAYSGPTVVNRQSGQTYKFLPSEGANDNLGGLRIIITENDLVFTCAGYNVRGTGAVSVWDMNNLQDPYIPSSSTNGEYVYPQNWFVKDPSLVDFGARFAVSEKNNLLAVTWEHGVQVFQIFGDKTPLQEFIFEKTVKDVAAIGDFLAIGHLDGVSVYKYVNDEYTLQKVFRPTYYPGPPVYGGTTGYEETYGWLLTLTEDSGKLLLVVYDGPRTDVRLINPVTLGETARYMVPLQFISHAAGEYAVLAYNQILHIPSGKIIGYFDNRPEAWLALTDIYIEKVSNNHINIYKAETVDTESGTKSYITTYSEYMLLISKPAKVRRGAVEFLTIPGLSPDYLRVFKGGEVHLAISASPGNRLYSIKETGRATKNFNNETGSVVYKIANIQSDTGVVATFKKSKGMKEFSVYTPSQKTIGRPLPTGEKPWRWFTSLPAGTWVAYSFDPETGETSDAFTKITVKANGKVSTVFPFVF